LTDNAVEQIYWFEQSERDVPTTDDWLSDAELLRMARLRIPKRLADWRLGRWTAKCAVAAALKLPNDLRALKQIVVAAAPTGEPEVVIASGGPAITISLSHRGGLAACAFALGTLSLGCDLELIEPKSEGFIADYFTAEEQNLVAQTAAVARPLLASLIWSAKESALKAMHVGLRGDTRSVAVIPGELQGIHTLVVDWRPLRVTCAVSPDFHGWWRCTGNILRTMVAAPLPSLPVELSQPSCTEAKFQAS
jgi:4'-phosphopantetheinyl transferase